MALNPPILPGPHPLPAGLIGEFFLLERDGIELSVSALALPKQVLKNARLFVTTLRLCVIAASPTPAGLQCFDIPLQAVSGEEFKQPIFGANALAGTVAAVPGRGLEGPASFRLTFLKGGCGTFLRVFFELIGKYREMDANARAAWLAPARMQAHMPTYAAFVDPSDPSRLFLQQPAVQQQAAAGPASSGGGGVGPAPPPPPPPAGYSYS